MGLTVHFRTTVVENRVMPRFWPARRLARLHHAPRAARRAQPAIGWCEIRIGELLGKGVDAMKSGKTDPSLGGEGSPPKDDRHKFRQLAEHKDVVVPLIEAGVVSRARLLQAIGRLPAHPVPGHGVEREQSVPATAAARQDRDDERQHDDGDEQLDGADAEHGHATRATFLPFSPERSRRGQPISETAFGVDFRTADIVAPQ